MTKDAAIESSQSAPTDSPRLIGSVAAALILMAVTAIAINWPYQYGATAKAPAGQITSVVLAKPFVWRQREGKSLDANLRQRRQDTTGWKSYDSKRARRGLEEWMRIGLYPGEDMWQLHSQFSTRTNNGPAADQTLQHLIETVAAPPWILTDGQLNSEHGSVRTRVQQWFDDAGNGNH